MWPHAAVNCCAWSATRSAQTHSVTTHHPPRYHATHTRLTGLVRPGPPLFTWPASASASASCICVCSPLSHPPPVPINWTTFVAPFAHPASRPHFTPPWDTRALDRKPARPLTNSLTHRGPSVPRTYNHQHYHRCRLTYRRKPIPQLSSAQLSSAHLITTHHTTLHYTTLHRADTSPARRRRRRRRRTRPSSTPAGCRAPDARPSHATPQSFVARTGIALPSPCPRRKRAAPDISLCSSPWALPPPRSSSSTSNAPCHPQREDPRRGLGGLVTRAPAPSMSSPLRRAPPSAGER